MKKIGILTYYYKCNNYGAILQAYALCNFLNKNGFNAEQICYVPKMSVKADKYITESEHSFLKYFKLYNYYKHLRAMPDKYRRKQWDIRMASLRKFQNDIPHSSKVYYRDTIKNADGKYDIFIAGSDQIWNPAWFEDAYFLNFVEDGRKISYAASLGGDTIEENKISYFKRYLSDYYAISVREYEAKKALENIGITKHISCVLDPTLLLTKEDWDSITKERRIQKKYLFCYFFGEGTKERQLAKEYAKQHNLKIVNFPHLYEDCITESDIGFGDYKVFDAGPEDFISFIKHAECVFTNSFHACVFSEIFQKKFFVFNRDLVYMNPRIYSICKLFECEDNFCDTVDKMNLEYINSVKFSGYSMEKVYKKRDESIRFLNGNLE